MHPYGGDTDHGAGLARQLAVGETADDDIPRRDVVNAMRGRDNLVRRHDSAAAELSSIHAQGFVSVAVTEGDEEAELVGWPGDSVDDLRGDLARWVRVCRRRPRRKQSGRHGERGDQGAEEARRRHGSSVGKDGPASPVACAVPGASGAPSEGIHMTTALITGATSGIGLVFARTLARRGHDIVLVARDRERLERVAAELRGHRVSVDVIPADLADRVQLGIVEEYLRANPVEILVNNAGFGVPQRFSTGDLGLEQQMLDVLVTAVMRLTHAALPGMVARGSGAVLNVSSVAGWITGGTYSASKAWVTVFSESLSLELAGSGVHVTAVCPGFTHTEFHQRAEMEMDALPEWMWLDPQEVVDRALADVRKGRPVSVAGPQYKVLSLAAQYLPRPLVRAIGARRPGGQVRAGHGAN